MKGAMSLVSDIHVYMHAYSSQNSSVVFCFCETKFSLKYRNIML